MTAGSHQPPHLNMKNHKLNLIIPVKSLAGILALTLLFACKPKETTTEITVVDETTPAPAVAATGTVRYDAQSTGSKMTIAGTSTIHDWTMESVNVGGYMEVDAKFPESALSDPAAAKPVVNVFIPVRTLKSGKSTMDKVMQEHMNEPAHKKIEYKLIELKPTSPAGTTGALKFDAVGALTVAGVTKTNSMPVTIEKVDGGKLKVSGTLAMKITDHGVKPPAPSILGMSPIKTGDDITLTFEWLTAPKAQ